MNLSTDDIMNIAEFATMEEVDKYEKLLSKEKFQYLKSTARERFIKRQIGQCSGDILETITNNLIEIENSLNDCQIVAGIFGWNHIQGKFPTGVLVFDKEAKEWFKKTFAYNLDLFYGLDFNDLFKDLVTKRIEKDFDEIHINFDKLRGIFNNSMFRDLFKF